MDDWTEVYERHGPLVWATVYRVLGNHAEALDCCQDVFAEVLTRSAARPIRNWPAFLRWLASRRAIDRLRHRRTDGARYQSDGDIALIAATDLDADARAIAGELTERFKRELSRLPEQQAEAFWLFSVEQLTYEEIAEQLCIEVNHVGVLVHRARQKLREWLVDLQPAERDSHGARKTM